MNAIFIMDELSSPSRHSRFGYFPAVFVLVGILAVFTMFWRLGDAPLTNWDEGIHAEVTRELVHGQTWVDLSYRGALYTAKPALKFWITAPLFAWWGETEFSARFWSAIAGVATALLLTVWMRQAAKSNILALLAGALFITGRFTLYHAFRTGETDGLFIFFLVASLYAYWRSWITPRWLIAAGAAVGLAFMTKSFAATIPACVMVIDATWRRGWSKLGLRTVLISAGVALAIALPWHIAEILRYGQSFWDSYFGFHVVERAGTILYNNNVPWYWYVKIIAMRTFPFQYLLFGSLLLAVRRAWRGDAFDRLLLVWAAVVFALFSLVRTKFDWYVLPIYPALVLTGARGIGEFIGGPPRRWATWLGIVLLFGTVYALPSGLAHLGALWRMTPYGLLPAAANSVLGRLGVSFASTALLMAAVLFIQRIVRFNVRRVASVAIAAALFAMAFGWYASYLRHLPTKAPYKTVASTLEKLNVHALDVSGISLVTQPAGNFYLQRVPDLSVRETRHPDPAAYLLTTAAAASGSASNGRRGILTDGTLTLFSPVQSSPF